MLAPTKLQDGDKVYHVGDTITFNAALRLFGNTSNAEMAGFALQLPIKIGSDVTGFTIENEGSCSLKISNSSTSIIQNKIKNRTNYYIDGTIPLPEMGLLNAVFHYPSLSGTGGYIAMLAFPSTKPTILTFT